MNIRITILGEVFTGYTISSIIRLDLSENCLEGIDCAKIISKILDSENKITQLDISKNNFYGNSIKPIAASLAKNTQIKEINVYDCVDKMAFTLLCKEGLVHNKSLEKVIVSESRIDCYGYFGCDWKRIIFIM